MPQSFDALKFADEMDQEEEQLLNSSVNALLMNWRRQRRGGNRTRSFPCYHSVFGEEKEWIGNNINHQY